jgi:hypothetical protein
LGNRQRFAVLPRFQSCHFNHPKPWHLTYFYVYFIIPPICMSKWWMYINVSISAGQTLQAARIASLCQCHLSKVITEVSCTLLGWRSISEHTETWRYVTSHRRLAKLGSDFRIHEMWRFVLVSRIRQKISEKGLSTGTIRLFNPL